MRPSVDRRLKSNALFRREVFYDLVSAESLVALLAVKKRIRKTPEMSRSHPCLRIHEYRTVHTDVVGTFLDELLPPCTLYIVLELNA